MKFSVLAINKNGSRIGILSGLQNNPQKSYETPLTLTITKGGSIPHLTEEVIHENFTEDFPLCIPSQHFINHIDVLKVFKKGVLEFTALQNHPVCVTVQDPATTTPTGFNNKTSVSVWGTSGRKKICPIVYSNLIEVMKPDWYESLNDADTPENCSAKRIDKSYKNSQLLLQKCLEIHKTSETLHDIGIFAPLLGGHNSNIRAKWAEEVSKLNVDGFTLLGLHQNGDSAENVDFSKNDDLIKSSLGTLPVNKPKQAQGAFSITSILTLVENGVDIFDSSLPYLLAENGKAMCFPNTFRFPLSPEEDNEELVHKKVSKCEAKDDVSKYDDTFSAAKKLRTDHEDTTKDLSLMNNTQMDNEDVGCYEINLNEKRFFYSQDPLIPGCYCYTCKTYSQSYIHHLLSVREMLSMVLLMLHNLHHWQIFFETIRKVVRADQLTEYRNFLIQYLNKNKT